MDKKFLIQATELAKQSAEPIKCAAVIVDGQHDVLAEAFNSQRKDNQAINHAEIKALVAASKKIGRKLRGATIYCSCEPCTMCLSALNLAGINRIVFAAYLKDVVPDYQIDIDPFDFISRFPHSPKLEYLPLK